MVGAVMNYCNVEKSEYYYAYYNQQGKREKGAAIHRAGGYPQSYGPDIPRSRR